MADVTFHDADRVAEKLTRRLRKHRWLRGVGVMRDRSEGFSISVRIAPDAPELELSERIDGVAVHVERRNAARALGA